MAEKPLSPDAEKRLRLMRYWLFALFCATSTIGVTASAVITGATSGGLLPGAFNGWPIVLIASVLCLAIGFGYEYWLKKQK